MIQYSDKNANKSCEKKTIFQVLVCGLNRKKRLRFLISSRLKRSSAPTLRPLANIGVYSAKSFILLICYSVMNFHTKFRAVKKSVMIFEIGIRRGKICYEFCYNS